MRNKNTGLNADSNINENCRFLILVEGDDDKNMLYNLMKTMDIEEFPPFQILRYGGKDNFKAVWKIISNLPKFTQIESLAIFRDADNSASSAFQSVQGRLKNSAWFPSNSVPNDTNSIQINEETPYKTGVFILPDNTAGGALEELLLSSLSSDVREHVEHYVSNAGSLLHENAKADYCQSIKTETYAYSSLFQVENFRDSFQKHAWNWQHEAFEPLRQFLSGFKN